MHTQTAPVSVLKASGNGQISGLAWSFQDVPDRAGDIILPSALKSAVDAHNQSGTLPALLVEHKADLAAGTVEAMVVSDRGLEVNGQIDLSTDVGRATYAKIQSRTLGAFSIAIQGNTEQSGRTRVFTDANIPEISIVADPMNAGSRIETVKSWSDVSTERDLERLLREVAGMPNRLARKTASAAWPVIEHQSHDQAALNAALARIIEA